MRTREEVLTEIQKTIKDYRHVLECYPATIAINAPRAMMQATATIKLNTLYWLLEEKRPKFKCDNFDKVNH